MNEWLEQALEKLDKQLAQAKSAGRAASIMAEPVADVLKDFCRQDGEFAQAVVQGGDFKACMMAVAKDHGTALSDLEAYRRAVRFYFPGAQVRFKLELDLVGDAGEAAASDHRAKKLLDFTDFL